MSEPILQLQHINKTFGKHLVNRNVNFSIKENSIFGLLGPNGAGKTTLIRIITNIIGADSGEIIFQGKALSSADRSLIGYLPEERGLYKKMKVGEQLMYLAQLKDLSRKEADRRIKEWMERFEIMDWWNKKVGELSKGMQQKVQFIATVIHEPKLLILDEPFSGLDPINTELIRKEIHRLRELGTTIIFSTHRMEQVEEICDDIVLINDGEVVLEGSVKEVRDRFKQNHYLVESNDEIKIPDGPYQLIPGTEPPNPNKRTFQIGEGGTPEQLLKELLNKGTRIVTFSEILPGLNEVFIKVVADEKEVVNA